jgi:hypothetical protein
MRALGFLFFSGAARGFFPGASHKAALLNYQLAAVCFRDSGAWDYCLARSFDLIARVGFVFTAIPLTEHGWGERAVTYLWGGAQQLKFFDLNLAYGLGGFLGALLGSFIFIFLTLVGASLLSVI